MKAQEHRMEDVQLHRCEADLVATVNALFRRWPTLCGFSVHEAAGLTPDQFALRQASELFVTQISIYPLRDLHAPRELCNEIVAALAALLDECPEVCGLMRERTFARVFH